MNIPKTRKTPRQRELAKIHIAVAQLGIDDDTYRDMLRQVAGVESAAKLNALGRARVLDHLAKAGFKKKAKAPRYPRRPKNMDRACSRADQLKKIEALLTV